MRKREIGAVRCRKPLGSKRCAGQAIAPIVEIADDERGQLLGGAKHGVGHHVGDLPAPLVLAEPQMPVHQVQQPLGRVDHHKLRPRDLRSGA